VLETELPEPEELPGGYNQSKWVAEKLLANARERGFPVSIYRPPGILGHSQSGIIENLDDPWCTLFKGCIQLRRFPDLPRKVGFVPVDYVSRALVYLSLQSDSIGKAFHLVNPHPPVSWQELFGMIQGLGYELLETPYEAWRDAVRQAVSAAPRDKLYAHLLLLANSPLFAAKPGFNAVQTVHGLRGSGIECPPVTRDLLAKYFAYFQKTNYIPAPSANAPRHAQ